MAAIGVSANVAADDFTLTGRYQGTYACDSTTDGVPSNMVQTHDGWYRTDR